MSKSEPDVDKSVTHLPTHGGKYKCVVVPVYPKR